LSYDAQSANCDQIYLSWTYNGGDDYTLYRKKDGEATWNPIAQNITEKSYTDNDIVSASYYEYKVTANDQPVDSNETGQISPCPSLPNWREVKTN
jgi:fibronectin type 3 domain-containing protein